LGRICIINELNLAQSAELPRIALIRSRTTSTAALAKVMVGVASYRSLQRNRSFLLRLPIDNLRNNKPWYRFLASVSRFYPIRLPFGYPLQWTKLHNFSTLTAHFPSRCASLFCWGPQPARTGWTVDWSSSHFVQLFRA